MTSQEKEEVWVPVAGFEGLYSISSHMRVRSEDRKSITGCHIHEKILKPGCHTFGYKKFTLCKNGKFFYVHRHRLMAKAFLPNPLNLPCINHIDNDTTNDWIENLEWCTFSHNTRHAYNQGRINKHGSKNSMSKINEDQAISIFNFKGDKKILEKEFGISRAAINDILAGRRWAWLTSSIAPKERKNIPDVLMQEIEPSIILASMDEDLKTVIVEKG